MFEFIFTAKLWIKMDPEQFSLEDDDGSDLFITQESWEIVPLFPIFEENYDKVPHVRPQQEGPVPRVNYYSDISDAEDFEIPPSQQLISDNRSR